MEQYQEFIKKTLYEAGQAALKRFGHDGVKYTKSSAIDAVTESDLISNHIISTAIKETFPEHGIISEEDEEPYQPDAEYIWIIDPIDGTNNFASHIPLFGIMAALQLKGEIQTSGVYLPITDEYFSATSGQGAYLNGEKIQCSSKKDWPRTFGCSSASLSKKKKKIIDAIYKAVTTEHIWLSRLGCAAVSACYVACGRRDWYLTQGGRVWDYAPTYLILKEAGCKVTNLDGEPWTTDDLEMLAANETLHSKLRQLF